MDAAMEQRNALMRARYEAGASTTIVGQEFGLHPSRVSRILRSIGTTMRPRICPWKADGLTYSGAHMRVRAVRGQASTHTCGCGAPAMQWAYRHDDPNELHSDTGAYSADPRHYDALCVPCHKRADLARIGGAS
jgi:hypothetical protein